MSAAPGTRLESLDVVRGVAVLGILLLNIIGFGMPEAAYFNPRAYGGWHGADLIAWIVNFIFFDGKMRGLFSFLFGASMLLVIERAEAADRSPARVHYARMGWLLLFGLAHLWLIWDGDILAHYALVGMIAYRFRHRGVRPWLASGIVLAAIGALGFLSASVQVHSLEQISGAAAQTPEHLHRVGGLVDLFGTPAPATIAAELAHYRSGYFAILADRFDKNLLSPVRLFLAFAPETLAYMLFGMAALRSGMLRGDWPRARYWRWLAISWGIAIPAYAGLALYILSAQFSLYAVTLAAFGLATLFRPLMILGWICLILLLARPEGALTRRLGAAGRMAFTNYLVTSLICTTLFYGYGFGWFGHFSRWQLYLVVAAVWALILLWSKPWLARFRFGPFEWAWRSLARGRLQPIRGPA